MKDQDQRMISWYDQYHFRLYMQSRWEDRHPDLNRSEPTDYSSLYCSLIILVCSLITIAANASILWNYFGK